MYIGTYTSARSKGIYLLDMDMETGALISRGVAAETPNPSFLALHPNQRFLYAANELSDFEGKKTGAVSAFAIDPKTRMLTLLNHQPSGTEGPCHVSMDRRGKHVLLANYGGGSVGVLPVQSDGRLGPLTASIQHTGSSVNKSRQEGPHAHSFNLDPANKFALAADLGTDKVMIYRFDSKTGTLALNDPAFASIAPGGGPRHLAFHPTGRYVYVNSEITSAVTAFQYDAEKGALTELHTLSTLPDGFPGENNSTAEIQVHPSGKFLYVSNRGHDSIAIFRIAPETGRLAPVGHESTQGKTPRNFGIDPTGKFLLAANQQSDTVVVFRIDPKTGKLTPTGHSVEVPSPVCVKFLR